MFVFSHVDVLDAQSGTLHKDRHVRIEGDRIAEVSSQPLSGVGARVIDGRGRVLMPGLIDLPGMCPITTIAQYLTKARAAGSSTLYCPVLGCNAMYWDAVPCTSSLTSPPCQDTRSSCWLS